MRRNNQRGLTEIGARIDRRMAALNMGPGDLAEAMGKSRQSINQLLRVTADPHVSTVIAVARALECSVAELVGAIRHE